MSIENLPLHVPQFQELCDVIRGGLQNNYKESSCDVVDCPNLSDSPYFLAAPGTVPVSY